MSTLRQWEAVVELVENLNDETAAQPHGRQSKLLYDLLWPQPLIPPAVWEKLVQEQVPLRLLKACAQHLQSRDVLSHAAHKAAYAASAFLAAACNTDALFPHTDAARGRETRSGSGGVEGAAGAASCSTASASTSSALNVSLLRQLEQSGLLEQLPATLTAATQQLQRLIPTAEAGRGGAGGELPLHSTVVALLQLAYTLLHLQAKHYNGAAFVPLPAAAGLILSSLRYLSCIAAAKADGQQQHGAWQPRHEVRRKWLHVVNQALEAFLLNVSPDLTAFKARNQSSASADSSSGSSTMASAAAATDAAVEQVLCSEECFLCLGVLTVASALPCAAMPTQLQPVGGGSGGSSDSDSGGGKASRQAGQQPQDQGTGCLPSQLPMQLVAVLQQAGVSTEVVCAMAQQVKHDRPLAFAKLTSAVMTCTKFADAQGLVRGLQGRDQGRFALLHKLMCAALLQLARMLASFDLLHLSCCSKCCCAARSSALQAKRLLQRQAHSSSVSRDADNSSSHDQRTSVQQSFDHSSCLRLVHDLLQHLLHLWDSAMAVLTAPDAPNNLGLPGSSSSGASSAVQPSVAAVLQGANGPVALRSISSAINMLSASLLPLLFDSRMAEGFAEGASASEQDVLTAVRLCSLLLQQTRASIEAVQATGGSSTVALTQSGQVLATTLQAAVADLLRALTGIAKHNQVWLQQLIMAAGASHDPGSLEQRRLFDLMCSLLKACSIDSNTLQQQPGFSLAGTLSIVSYVALVASERVDAPAKQDTTAAAQGSPTAMLPWLVLLGRCCLLWARWLQQLSAVEVAEAASAQEQLVDQWARNGTWGVTQAAAAAADPWAMLPGQYCMKPTPASKLHCVRLRDGGTVGLSVALQRAANCASAWLSAGSNMQQLADLGYNVQPLQAALAQLYADAAAIATSAHSIRTQQPTTNAGRAAAEASSSAELTSVIALCPQLQVVGQALTAFAMPLACNNPGCVNASGPSEARLASGKSSVCGGCLTARYCSRACLKQHWAQHKPVCKALAAAAAAAAAATRSDATAAVNTLDALD